MVNSLSDWSLPYLHTAADRISVQRTTEATAAAEAEATDRQIHMSSKAIDMIRPPATLTRNKQPILMPNNSSPLRHNPHMADGSLNSSSSRVDMTIAMVDSKGPVDMVSDIN